jgi:hypothetical protein
MPELGALSGCGAQVMAAERESGLAKRKRNSSRNRIARYGKVALSLPRLGRRRFVLVCTFDWQYSMGGMWPANSGE